MHKRFAPICYVFGLAASIAALSLPAALADTPVAAKASLLSAFLVSPHDDVSIEWWYLNAHLSNPQRQHLSVVASFFRFGNGKSLSAAGKKSSAPALDQHSYYLIYAVTDENKRSQQAHSFADANSLQLLKQAASLMLLRDPNSKEAQSLLALSSKDRFPPPTVLIAGACKVTDRPNFSASYGSAASVSAVPGRPNTFELAISPKGTEPGVHLDLTFSSSRPPMYVGGTGNTGVTRPDDMKYVSLTRCAVTGTVGSGTATAFTGLGWFDHQWGSSWTPEAVGWDWWGIQLGDGRDILFYRMRHMRNGSIFSPIATIEDATGKITVTHDLVFSPDLHTLWTSPATHIAYPVNWDVDFPDQNLALTIRPNVAAQEMPILGSEQAIWEGSVYVDAEPITFTPGSAPAVSGFGYQELVGYNSATVAKLLPKPAAPRP